MPEAQTITLLSITEACERLGVTREHVHRYMRAGFLTRYELATRRRHQPDTIHCSLAEVEALLAERGLRKRLAPRGPWTVDAKDLVPPMPKVETIRLPRP